MFFLLISITTAIDIGAQTEPYSNEAVSNELNTYISALQVFNSHLENVPINFIPQSLNDYEEYLGESANIRIKTLSDTYEDLINYLQDYESYHGNGSLQSYFSIDLEDVNEMPDCFDTWYANEVSITVTATLCCMSGVGCPACITGGLIASTVNMGVYEECMKQYDENP